MSDYASSLPVRTENAGDIIAKLGDATIPSQQLAISAAGEAKVQVTQPLPSGTNNIGDVDVASLPADIDIRDLVYSQDSVQIKDSGGDALAISAAGEISALVTSLPGGLTAYDEDSAHVSGDKGIQLLAVRKDTGGTLVSADGDYSPLQVTSSGSLRATLPSISTSGGAAPGSSNLVGGSDGTNLQPIKVSSAGEVILSGSYLEDAGHSSGDRGFQILAVRNDTNGALTSADLDYSPIAVSSSGAVKVSANFTAANGGTLPSQEAVIAGYDGANVRAVKTDAAGELQVDVLSQPALSYSTDSVQIKDSAGDALAINGDGSLNVVVQTAVSGDDIINYDTTSSVAVGASDNHDYTVTAGKTLLLKQILITGSGKLKAEMQIETSAGSNVFNTIAVLFNSTAEPNMYLGPVQDISVGPGIRVRVTRTNRDNQSQDVHSTIFGVEI